MSTLYSSRGVYKRCVGSEHLDMSRASDSASGFVGAGAGADIRIVEWIVRRLVVGAEPVRRGMIEERTQQRSFRSRSNKVSFSAFGLIEMQTEVRSYVQSGGHEGAAFAVDDIRALNPMTVSRHSLLSDVNLAPNP
ncbi:hypothetical protein LTR10_008099 [Elasticomyces elasticus]|nr:hypothetical protein LTR10_008099 [Elasticomyces elasticus]